ncbi:MAG TPA: hypothetical protein PK825_00280 [Bacteroidales bacterium]|nr:hypothetical protein [Bacteroidales bacterium]
MARKNLIFLFTCFLIAGQATAQEFATDKGAGLFNITGSFTSSGGSLFEDDNGHYSNTGMFGLTASRFVARNVFLGLGVGYGRQSQGDLYSTTYGVGPHIGLAAGGQKSQGFPFITFGIRYYGANFKTDSWSGETTEATGSDIFGGIGIVIPIKKYVGFTIEGNYHALSLNDQNDHHYGGKIFTLGIGLIGVFYK